MRKRLWLLIAGSALVLAACSDTGGDSLADGTETMPTSGTSGTTAPATGGSADESAASETMAEVQAELDQLSDAISESEAAEELTSAWNTLSTELAASIATMREDGTISREEVESGLENSERRLDELDVEEEVRPAGESLRPHLEQVMTCPPQKSGRSGRNARARGQPSENSHNQRIDRQPTQDERAGGLSAEYHVLGSCDPIRARNEQGDPADVLRELIEGQHEAGHVGGQAERLLRALDERWQRRVRRARAEADRLRAFNELQSIQRGLGVDAEPAARPAGVLQQT